MRNRTTRAWPWVASVVVLTIAATGAAVDTGHAQLGSLFQAVQQEPAQAKAQAAAQAKADECLARPGATAPKGSHWYYRIDRPTKRRCWYLGAQKSRSAASAERTERAGRPAPATRRAVPIPAPAPNELRPDEATRAEAPAAVTTEARSAAPAESNGVASTNFSATWPAGASGGPYVPAASAAPASESVDTATTETAAEEMPAVWPVMSDAERAAAVQPAGATSGSIAQLLIFLAATVAFVALAIRTVFKLAASRRARPEPREPVRRAEPVIRRREPGRFPAAEPSIEAMSEPAIARLREVARRWDTPARVPRQPRLPAFELEPDYEVKSYEPRRRRAVA